MAGTVDYQALSQDLENIVAQLNEDGIDVDEAMQLFERGQELITELEKYLKSAENKIQKIANLKEK